MVQGIETKIWYMGFSKANEYEQNLKEEYIHKKETSTQKSSMKFKQNQSFPKLITKELNLVCFLIKDKKFAA